jgi:tetratricopeptide (TPR) repeat protein
MSGHLPPVEAYRRDLARLRRTTSFGEEDDGWLLLAHVVHQRAASSAVADVEPLEEDAGALRRLAVRLASAPRIDGALVAELSAAALRMESAGALLLAASMLASLDRALGDALARERGRIVAQWARVERVLGETDVAADLYERVRRLGIRHKLPELLARADLGLGVLARMRGNYPEARQRFRRGLAVAERAGLAELTGLAHQSLMIAAAVARDFDTALSHGWAALAHVAGNRVQEADVLLNLASLCLDMGEDEAALRGFLSAGERATKERIHIAARAGAAVAAARLGDRDLLAACISDVEQALLGEMAPYERAQRLLTLSDAWRAADESAAAESARERGIAIALAHGFAELVHQYGEPVTLKSSSPSAELVPLGADARRVVVALSGFGAPGVPS